MGAPSIQTSFHTGEWAPALNARVDLQKYHSAAALMKNFFVDYRGGASTRTGTKYIAQCFKSATDVRLIPFQAATTLSYVLEFGDKYMRVFNQGVPILEQTKAITAATNANPCQLTVNAHGYSPGQWFKAASVGGMTQLNNRFFIVRTVPGANTITLSDLNGVAIDSTAYGVYTAGGTTARVYTIPTPFAAADVALLKFAQNVSEMVITHPNYPPHLLTFVGASLWYLYSILFGTTIPAPTIASVVSSLGAGSVDYSYIVTSIDANGQESVASTPGTLATTLDFTITPGSNVVTWGAITGAVSYNVYRAELSYSGALPAGSAHGYIGFTDGFVFTDTAIDADFSISPPVAQIPFDGTGVASVTVTASGTYTTVPFVTFSASGVTATGRAILQVQGTPTIGAGGGIGWSVGDAATFPNEVVLIVATVLAGAVATFQPITYNGSNPGAILSGNTPANPVDGVGPAGQTTTANLVWGVGIVELISTGQGYLITPTITFSAGAAAATAVLAPLTYSHPTVPIFFQQRLTLAGPLINPQRFNMSQPGSFFNFNISNPVQPDDAITGTIVSGQLNSIKSMVSMPTGLIILSDRQAWLVSGGGPQTAITPIDVTAQSQAYNGANDVPPIVVNYDIIYVQAKGSSVRDLTYNFYTNIYTGTDISVLSSHLFYGYTIEAWAYAEEPFKIVQAIRNDGVLLTLTFLKEQELIGWTHADTQGTFESVASVTEAVSFGIVDAVYTVVERVVNGFTVKYVERFAERIFPNGVADAWCVDAGLQYTGAPATTFSGAWHLAGKTVTGLADGVVIPPFVMGLDGTFTLATPASKVTVGLAFTPQLQTLALDLGEPTVQGKQKNISSVTVRCADTLGLSIGKTFSTLVPMKDLIVGNVGSQTNQVVTGLVTGDAYTVLDPSWDEPGQYCIQQSYPLPASILGVIPEITVGDTNERGGR